MLDFETRDTVDQYLRADRRIQAISFLVLLASVSLIIMLSFLVPELAPLAFVGIIGLLALLLVWRHPVVAVYSLVAGAMLLEQWPIEGMTPITAEIPFYGALSGMLGLPVIPSPLEMILGISLGVLLIKAIIHREWHLSGGQFAVPIAVFLAMVLVSLLFGLAGGAGADSPFNWSAAWAETRSFVYLGIAYLLAANLITNRHRLTTFIWILIVAIGLKGLQGMVRFVDEQQAGLDLPALTGHEDVIFLVSALLLLATLYYYGGHHRQLVTLFLLMPPMAFTLFATTRRMAFIVLGFTVVLFAISLLKEKRSTFFKIAPVVLAVAAVYLTLLWDSPDTVAGQPVRAIQSQIGYTDERDFLSDYWRDLENINIERNIEASPFAGIGFGREYEFYVEQPTLDLTGFVFWTYITHNAIFWIWMKMGIFGWIAFWWLFGSAIVYSLVQFRTLPDPYLRSIALFVAISTVGVVIFAYGDLGLTYARPMLFIGLLLGVLSRLPTIAAEDQRASGSNENEPSTAPGRAS